MMSRRAANNLLEVCNLSIFFRTEGGVVEAVRDISFEIPAGRTVALLGESGCGKSVTARAILNLIDPPGYIAGGQIRLRAKPHDEGEPYTDLLALDPNGERMRRLRWAEVSMIFQEPRHSLTPVYSVGDQIVEAIVHHEGLSRADARSRAIECLRQVGIPAAERRFDEYPHQMSGGMCQRVMIAMALSCHSRLLIADEPTTALDVTIQAQVLEILRRAQTTHGTSILLITHDMGVVAEMADEVIVMYLGRIVERGPAIDVFDNPRHPYTRELFASMPRPDLDRSRPLPSIAGSVPSPLETPAGCPFRGRCPEEMNICRSDPAFVPVTPTQSAACWLYQSDERQPLCEGRA